MVVGMRESQGGDLSGPRTALPLTRASLRAWREGSARERGLAGDRHVEVATGTFRATQDVERAGPQGEWGNWQSS